MRHLTPPLAPLALLALTLATGCGPKTPPPPPPVVAAYDGALYPTQTVVNTLAARAAAVRTVWSRHSFTVTALDAQGKPRTLSGDGVLLLRKPPLTPLPSATAGTPTDLRLTGKKDDLVGEVFDLGVNRDRAWLILRDRDNPTLWWLPRGASPAPQAGGGGEGGVPVRPDLLPEVLGLQDWSTDLNRYPTPVVTYDPALDAYRVTLVEPAPTPAVRTAPSAPGLTTRREYLVTRANLVIQRVTLFAADGRPSVIADLKNWIPLAGTESQSPPALVPSDIQIQLPLTKASMRFTLRDPAPTRGRFPSDVSFSFPPNPDVRTTHRLDQPADQ